MFELLREYRKVPRHILLIVAAEFFVQLVNSSFLAIQPLFMQNNGYSDAQSAGYIGYRFLGVLILALPLGFYIKNKKIKNLFYLSGFGVPLFALAIIYSTAHHMSWMIYGSQLLWGASFTFIQIPILPYIFRTSPKETHIAAITLSYSTWSFASIAGGFTMSFLSHWNKILFNEEHLLIIMSVIGLSGIAFIASITMKEELPDDHNSKLNFSEYDWKRIIKALIPTALLAVGAGFAIPFLNLFFVNVHGMSTSGYSLIYSISAILVTIGALAVPKIKTQWGYQKAVPFTQSLAIVALVIMSTTQYYNEMNFAIYIAVVFFLLRQPLMNMAGPMTTDVVMNYVGQKNREMVSALTMAIWSGSWFISSRIFQVLRENQFSYAAIFLITAVIYIVAVAWYYFLIKEYKESSTADQ